MSALTILAFDFQNALDNLEYQIVGIIVVLSCLGFLAVILGITSWFSTKATAKPAAPAPVAKAQPAPQAPAAQDATAIPSEVIAAITAAVDTTLEGTNHQIVSITPVAPADYSSITPELIAVITAAIDTALDGAGHRIINIEHAPLGYAASGRSEIFASRRLITNIKK